MDLTVDLGQMMAFILVDKENISGKNVVKPVVDEKLLSAGDRIIHFITVVDMHIHRLLIAVQMRHREIFPVDAVGNGLLAGMKDFHAGCLLCDRIFFLL